MVTFPLDQSLAKMSPSAHLALLKLIMFIVALSQPHWPVVMKCRISKPCKHELANNRWAVWSLIMTPDLLICRSHSSDSFCPPGVTAVSTALGCTVLLLLHNTATILCPSWLVTAFLTYWCTCFLRSWKLSFVHSWKIAIVRKCWVSKLCAIASLAVAIKRASTIA